MVAALVFKTALSVIVAMLLPAVVMALLLGLRLRHLMATNMIDGADVDAPWLHMRRSVGAREASTATKGASGSTV